MAVTNVRLEKRERRLLIRQVKYTEVISGRQPKKEGDIRLFVK